MRVETNTAVQPAPHRRGVFKLKFLSERGHMLLVAIDRCGCRVAEREVAPDENPLVVYRRMRRELDRRDRPPQLQLVRDAAPSTLPARAIVLAPSEQNRRGLSPGAFCRLVSGRG